ncbi:MAG: hypothetical protein L0I24_23855, partial [Pseudonocardia sp.]|nr:hypothetical protein [Pseudonocardia sp.]
ARARPGGGARRGCSRRKHPHRPDTYTNVRRGWCFRRKHLRGQAAGSRYSHTGGDPRITE